MEDLNELQKTRLSEALVMREQALRADIRREINSQDEYIQLASEVPDPGIVIADDADSGAAAFIQAIARHRHFQRETDPPLL